MDTLLKFTSVGPGKDRVFAATQFACALSTHLLKDSDRKDLLEKLRNVESSISSGRKLLKLGNAVNSVAAAHRSMRLSDRVLRLCLTAAHVSRALSFICDNALWARGVGLIRDIQQERWSRISARLYFLSVIMNVSRDAYVLLQLMTLKARDKDFRQSLSRHLSQNPEAVDVVVPQLDAFLFLLFESLKAQPAVALDTLKNVCDIFSPLNRLGIYQSNAGVIAFCGLISSLIGVVTVAKPSLNMKP